MRARVVSFVLGTVLVVTPAAVVADAAAAPAGKPPPHPSAVILDWERTSFRTVYGPPTGPPRTPIPVGVLHLGFVSLAMYDAVVTSTRGGRASDAAAAATAAHDVLVAYFPTSAADLDAALATSLAAVKDGPAEDLGVEAGEQAAARMLARRPADDAVRTDPTIVYDQPMEPGYWQPVGNPPVPMLAPWLGSIDPLVLDSLVELDGPDDLASADYTADYDELLRLGSVDSAERTELQTETARFFNSNSAIMVGEATVDLLEDEPMGLRRTARLFAVMHGAMADSVIKCWEVKRDVGFWRPFQAIAGWDTDQNPDTGPWTGPTPWVPLLPNPPYSDYVSGHGSLTAPAIETIRRMMGEDTALTLHSYALNSDREYDDLSTIEDEAFHARIWGGFHFRDAMEDAYYLGHETARRVLREIR